MHRLAFVTLLLAPMMAVADVPTTVTVEAAPQQFRLHRGDMFAVTVRLLNSAGKASFRIMNCAWTDSWHSSDAKLAIENTDCGKNFEVTLDLAPGAVDARSLPLSVASGAAFGAHALRLGFRPIGATITVWSPVVTVKVIEVAGDLTLAGKTTKPREIAFEIANTTALPVEIAEQVVLQHYVAGVWIDVTQTSAASATAASVPRCMKIAPGGHVGLDWTGMTCWPSFRQACHATRPADAGEYRLVAQSCDGTRDYVGSDVSLAAP